MADTELSHTLTFRPRAPTATRLNIGCGNHPLPEWCNIDNDPSVPADLYISVPPIPYDDGSLQEIFAGHYLEHLTPEEADLFLSECHRCLAPGGKLGVVVPDTREVMRRHLNGIPGRIEYPLGHWQDVSGPHGLNVICQMFLYSTVQDSGHKWSYDYGTLKAKVESAGFRVVGEINRWSDRRLGMGAWYQTGVDAVKE